MYSYNQDILELTFDEDINGVIMRWTGLSASEDFRLANEDVLDLLIQHQSNALIADCREMKIIKLADQQWLYTNWIPRVIAAGLKYAAIVESEDYFNRLAVKNVSQEIENGLQIKYFTSFLMAKSWIKRIRKA